jgi:5-hydroxyisourate hydrolase
MDFPLDGRGICWMIREMGKLTTHVLDTVSGKPAPGVQISLFRGGILLSQTVTNTDGRCDAPLLEGPDLIDGDYELVFSIGRYFRDRGIESPFLDEVPVRFRMETSCNYHVPLVCSPWAYSTYRGS